MSNATTPQPAVVTGPLHDRFDEILTADTLDFLGSLHERYESSRRALLAARDRRQEEINAGAPLSFLEETRSVREADWRVAPPAPGLTDRRCEITGPTDRRMTINALNSGARVWMADFEDANTPSWENIVGGQVNLADAIDNTIEYSAPDGREYRLGTTLATIVVRPRGWHLAEKHVTVDGDSIAGALFDFGCYAMTCLGPARPGRQRPYFYLPKTESHLEAWLWNDVFTFTEERFGVPIGTIRATVLIETILAAFEMDEILYELRDHAAGLNAGRWDYLFSLIKKFAYQGGSYVLPDRNSVTMAAPFMRAYTDLLVKTCHRRGAHAIGGMAAFIPSRRDPEVNAVALAKVREDKTREATAGFDGSWVAHPDLVAVCTEVFDEVLGKRENQIDHQRDDVEVAASDLVNLVVADAEVTEAGLRNNIGVSLRYLAAWLRGSGAVAIFNLMEDVATAEIARSQVWQWLRYEIALDTGTIVTEALVRDMVAAELLSIAEEHGDAYDAEAFEQARDLLFDLVFAAEFTPFLTLAAYERLP